MSTILIAVIILLYSFQTLFCTLFNDRYTGSKAASPYVFCVVEAIAIPLVSLAFNGFRFAPSGLTVLLGVLNAAMLFVYNTSLIAAGRRGSYAFLNVMMLFGGILIPIVTVLPLAGNLQIIAMSACLAGAVCGDHCSPISDTTIMSSAGARCRHINHVSTQLPYAITVAAISFCAYIVAGFVQNWMIVLPIFAVVTVLVLFAIRAITKSKAES